MYSSDTWTDKAGDHMMDLDFHDKPVENEFDRMFDYDVDGVLNPVEQANRLDFMTGGAEEIDDDDEYEADDYSDSDDDDDGGYSMSEEERRKWEEKLNAISEANKIRKQRKNLIIIGILSVACIVFAKSPGIILFIGAMILSAKISKII